MWKFPLGYNNHRVEYIIPNVAGRKLLCALKLLIICSVILYDSLRNNIPLRSTNALQSLVRRGAESNFRAVRENEFFGRKFSMQRPNDVNNATRIIETLALFCARHVLSIKVYIEKRVNVELFTLLAVDKARAAAARQT